MLNRNMRAVAIILTGMAALAPFQPAAAQDGPVVVAGESENLRTARVSFADLDLATGAGARKLESRVAAAVKDVCLFDREIRLQPSDYAPCANDSWDRARPQMAAAIAGGGTLLGASAITVSAR